MKQSQFPLNPFINTAELFGLKTSVKHERSLCDYCGYVLYDNEDDAYYAEDACTCDTECLDCGQLGRDCVCPEDMSGATEGDR